MAIGSGLGAQLGFAAESTYGTSVTPTRFLPFDDESLSLEQRWSQGNGLAAGRTVRLAGQSVQTTRSAGGSVTMDFATKGMGLLIRHMIGSSISSPTIVSGSAYRAYHELGDFTGLSLTTQVGRPQPDGTVRPYTYTGCKVASWELSQSENENLKLTLEFVAQDEKVTSPALATATYTTGMEAFPATTLVAKIGGTASTASSVVSVSGNSTVAAVVKSWSLKGTNPFQAERFGTSATTAAPIQNDFTDITLDLDAEFNTQAEFYDVYRAGTVTPVQLTWTQTTAISGANYPTLDIILSAAKFTKVTPAVGGPDIVRQAITATAYHDGTNSALQIGYMSSDTTL
jgi:hypothetical protein